MDRRDMIRSLSATLAIPFLGSVDDAFAAGEAIHRSMAEGAGYRALDGSEQRLVESLADRILPATTTPGALDVQVPAFIDRLLTEWYEPADATAMRSDLSAIDAHANSSFGAPFASLPEASQLALMTELDSESGVDTPARRGFRQIKSLTVFAYFTSERVSKEVLRTEIVFPSYDGCAPMNG